MFNVLLVDDEELALITLQHALPWREYGFTDIHSTTSSQDALELLKKKRFDACFIDIRMPNMNGLELIAAAQQYELETLFVIVSGYSDFSYAKQAIQYGVLDYCLKPIVTEDCIPVLEKLPYRIFSSRISYDPVYVSKLLHDETFCQGFLSGLTTDSPECRELTLLQVHSKELLTVLRQLDKFLPEQIFFLGKDDAMLLWKDFSDINSLQAIALLIYDTIPPTVDSFQSSFMRLNIACQTVDTSTTKILKMSSTNKETAAYFSNILNYIENNYNSQLKLKELSRKFGMNYSYLSQLFKKMIGVSFAEHLTNIRLTHACKLLSETSIPIVDIAESVGFNDYHYFCSTFKRCYSMTPSQYRSTSGKGANS